MIIDTTQFFIIAGPCLAESKELLQETARTMHRVCADLNIPYIFKASFKKANRTSASSFTGIGDDLALRYLAEIREEFGVPVLTDIHSEYDAERAAEYVDVLQIPAFLCRQTDLLQAAGRTGKYVNIKKGQFLAPDDMQKAVGKIRAVGNEKIWLTERGTSFGYHDLVVDFRSLLIMRQAACPVIYDATHSLQQPSIGEQSGGLREYILPLARGAVAVGIDGLFFETHPDPINAKSDSATQLPLAEAEQFVRQIDAIRKTVSNF